MTQQVDRKHVYLYWLAMALLALFIFGGPYYVHHQCLKNGNPPDACHQ